MPTPEAAVLVRQSTQEMRLDHVPFGETLTFAEERLVTHFVDRTGHGRPHALHVSIVSPPGLPTRAIARTLIEAGVPPDNVTLYKARPSQRARTVRLIAEAYVAEAPVCGLHRRHARLDGPGPMPGLGCAQEAALAAQIVDPRDLLSLDKRPGAPYLPIRGPNPTSADTTAIMAGERVPPSMFIDPSLTTDDRFTLDPPDEPLIPDPSAIAEEAGLDAASVVGDGATPTADELLGAIDP